MPTSNDKPRRPKLKTERIMLTLSPQDKATLEQAHASTYAQHRLPFTVWITRTLIDYVTRGESK